ncbi:hypothetical protein C8Q79DRAFT_299319 [Trametes meyenii]|nr:hypothetical protein C8Q79DRAFT_299319 [Trametes meyenii]
MWVLTAPFDEEYEEDPPPHKSKLLKTGREYTLGRKDHPLQVKSKAISKTHAVFVVGECSEEQAADPTFIPTLTFNNVTSHTRVIERPTISIPRIKCYGSTSLELVSEDVIHLSNSIMCTVRWERVCCYNGGPRAGPSVSASECAALGIHIVPTLQPEITHYLTPTYSLTPSIATSLVSLATLVRPEWLIAILDAGRVESGELSTLEDTFVLPSTSKFRPAFTPALPPRARKFDAWLPDEARVGLFLGRRFVFAGEKGAEAPAALRELVKRAEGEYECVAVQGGRERMRQVLAKARAREMEVVLVADRYACVPVVGEDGWRELVEEARSFELRFVQPEKVVEAVVYADVAFVNSSLAEDEEPEQSMLLDVIPNTIEDEPSIPPSTAARDRKARYSDLPPEPEVPEHIPRRKLPRRATSRASSRAPSPPPPPFAQSSSSADVAEPQPAESIPPRRTLVRRAGRPKAVVGIDGISMDVEGNLVGERASEGPISTTLSSTRRTESTVPTTPGRSSRLKRRVGTRAQTASNELFPMSANSLVSDLQEPPHKKFKALFEESDPDKVAHMNLDEYGSQHADPAGESMTQYEPSMQSGSTQARGRGGTLGSVPLEALVEEEEEGTLTLRSTPQMQTETRGMKRKSQSEDAAEDVEMGDEERPRAKRRIGDDGMSPSSQAPRSTQSQAHGSTSQPSVRSKPLSKIVTRVDMAQPQVHVKEKTTKKLAGAASASSAMPAQPDKDAAFLKAVASTKRGKKMESRFDREFNNLRISKPDLEREEESKAWAVLEEFGDDGDVRGNFMVVMEMPIFRESGKAGAGVGAADHLRRGEGRLEWQGRPDFKKFRRKTTGERRHPVELVVEDDNDLGIGSQYWKGTSDALPSSQTRTQAKPESRDKRHTSRLSSQQRAKSSCPMLVSDDEGSEEESLPKKPASRSKSQPRKSQSTKPSSSQSTRKARIASQNQPLFVDSDIEEMDEDGDGRSGQHGTDNDNQDSCDGTGATLRSGIRETQTSVGGRGRVKKRLVTAILDEDSDDGATFKAVGTKARPRRR